MKTQTDLPEEFRMIEELQLSEARFRALFENTSVGIGIMGLDRKVIDVNPALCRMYGRTREELIGQSPDLVTYEEDFGQSTTDFESLISGDQDIYQSERRYRRKNGEVFWAQVTMNIVRNAAGIPIYLTGMVVDIDERKRTTLELRRSEEQFRAAFDSSAIGMGLLGVDGKILKVNQAVCEISGYPEEELLERFDQDNAHPEDRDLDRELIAEMLSGQRNSYEVEKRYIRKDGQVIWARLNVSAVRNSDGSISHLVGMIEDIDEQKKIREELRESEARFRAIFDNVAVGVAVMGLDRRPIEFNQVASKIVGYSADELRDIDPRMLAVEEDRDMDTEWFRELAAGERDSYVMERRYRRKDGQVFWARINYSLVRDVNGSPGYLIGLIEDIDDQKRASDRLAEQEQAYRQNLEIMVAERTRELQKTNRQLKAEINQREKAEKALAEKAAQDAIIGERSRLARDLHDAVTQTLFSTSMIAEVLPDLWDMNPEEGKRRLEELRQLTRGSLAEMRTLLIELRPATLVQIPLHELLRQLCESLIGRARLPIEFSWQGEAAVPSEVKIAIYRISQEALNNIVKHAKATRVKVSLDLNSGVQLSISDDGCGFDLSSVPPDHLGLRIMCERAEAIQAECEINSTPGEGTQIRIHWKNTEPDNYG